MTDNTKDSKRPRGRPVEKAMPEAIPDTPENIMRAILKTSPRKDGEWRYLEKDGED